MLRVELSDGRRRVGGVEAGRIAGALVPGGKVLVADAAVHGGLVLLGPTTCVLGGHVARLAQPAAPTGVITITYNGTTLGVSTSQNTLLLSPYVRSVASTATGGGAITLASAQSTGATGSIDWACTSVATVTGSTLSTTAPAAGTMLAKYAPSQCR